MALAAALLLLLLQLAPAGGEKMPLECQPWELRPYFPLYHIIGNVTVPPRRPNRRAPSHCFPCRPGEMLPPPNTQTF